jgi:hypothetical protein
MKKVEFNFGDKGLFNAKEEVVKPILAIVEKTKKHIKFNFDFSQVDEYGYPSKGTLTYV